MQTPPPDWDPQQQNIEASFLQSSWWGEFQAAIGAKAHFLRGTGWSCLLLEKRNRFGKYLFSQYGPTVTSPDTLKSALAEMKEYSRKLGAAWLSLEPMSSKTSHDDIKKTMTDFKAKPPARHREPDLTRIIDLSPPSDELLASISQSTRSFIRKNQREQLVSFCSSTNPKDMDIFIKMLGKLSQRKNVYFFSDSYFKTQAQLLMSLGVMSLEFAMLKDKPVASAVFFDYGDMCTYLYAAAVPEASKYNVSALLLWQAILNAKGRGLKQMDLYGVAPENAPATHPWAGFTAFKAKFGGGIVRHPGTWDMSLSPRYQLYKSAHRARKILKRH